MISAFKQRQRHSFNAAGDCFWLFLSGVRKATGQVLTVQDGDVKVMPSTAESLIVTASWQGYRRCVSHFSSWEASCRCWVLTPLEGWAAKRRAPELRARDTLSRSGQVSEMPHESQSAGHPRLQ